MMNDSAIYLLIFSFILKKDINIGVRKLPHYAFYLNGGECDQVKGNKPDELRSEVRRFYNFLD